MKSLHWYLGEGVEVTLTFNKHPTWHHARALHEQVRILQTALTGERAPKPVPSAEREDALGRDEDGTCRDCGAESNEPHDAACLGHCIDYSDPESDRPIPLAKVSQ